MRLLWTYTGLGVAGLLLAVQLVAQAANGDALDGPVGAGAFLLGVASLAALLYAGQQWATYFWNRRR
jgi:hypothetical protein